MLILDLLWKNTGYFWTFMLCKAIEVVLYKKHRKKQVLASIGWADSTKVFSYFSDFARSRQSCLTLCDPLDGSPPGSPDPGILQARTLEWVAISFSSAWKWKVKAKSLNCVRLLATPWTAAYQAPPSMGIFQARVLEWGAIAFSVSDFSL